MRRRDFLTGLLLTAATARGVQAQQSETVYRIAYVHPALPVAAMGEDPLFQAFFEELRRLGYVEGTNLVVTRYSGEGRTERYAELARDVVSSKPDVIFMLSVRLLLPLKQATTTIPVVGTTVDPIAMGLTTSLSHPGGNITGIVVDAGIATYEPKRLEVLREAVPGASRVGFLAPRAVWENPYGVTLREAARESGIQLVGPLLDSPVQEAEYRRVFAAMAQEQVDALVVIDTPENFANRRIIIDLAEEYRLPTLYPIVEYARAGGLIAWGVEVVHLFRRAADMVGEILKGAKPGDIPFYQATKVELVINLKTAKALGMEIPPSLLARADEVIE